AGGEAGFEYVDAFLVEGVDEEGGGFQQTKPAADDGEGERNAEDGAGRLVRKFGNVAEASQECRHQEGACDEAGLNGEQRGGEDQAGGSAAEFPFAVVGDVAI